MEFFEDLSNTLNETAAKTKKAAETMTEIAKLRYTKKCLEGQRSSIYRSMGKLVYENHTAQIDAMPALSEACCEVDALCARISRIDAQLCKLCKRRHCTSCGAQIPRDSVFCNTCGAKQQTDASAHDCEEPAADTQE